MIYESWYIWIYRSTLSDIPQIWKEDEWSLISLKDKKARAHTIELFKYIKEDKLLVDEPPSQVEIKLSLHNIMNCFIFLFFIHVGKGIYVVDYAIHFFLRRTHLVNLQRVKFLKWFIMHDIM